MTALKTALEAAAGEGIITADQAQALEPYLSRRGVVVSAPTGDRLLDDARFNAVILGPAGGVGPELAARVEATLLRRRALVIDADAISCFAGMARSRTDRFNSSHRKRLSG